jgi:hypothetical protein
MQCFVCENPFTDGAEPAEVWADSDRFIVICASCTQPQHAAPPEHLLRALQRADHPVQARAASHRIASFHLRAHSMGVQVKSRCILERSNALQERSRLLLGRLMDVRSKRSTIPSR